MNALWCRVLFSYFSGYWLYSASVDGHEGNQGLGGQNPRMDVMVLLSVAVQHQQSGFQVPQAVFLDLIAHIPDKTPGKVPGQKIPAFQ